MRYQQLGLEDYEELADFLKGAYLPAPYQHSLKESQNLIRFALFHEKKWVFALKEKNQIRGVTVFLQEKKQLFVETFLLSRYANPSLGDLRQTILQAAQSTFSEKMVIPKTPFLFTTEKNPYYHLPKLKTALVLGGGGAKGAYQIGAYEALLENDISYDLVAGTSVGGLNGGLILQGDLEKAKNLWENIENTQILDLQYDETGLKEYATSFFKTAVKNRGISTVPLQNLVEEYILPEKIKSSPQEFYVVTTAFPQLEEKVIDVKHVPNEEVASWLVASSSFYPGMEMKEINGQRYVDGGYKNNIPVDVALLHGATRLIVMDVKGPGITKDVREILPLITLKTPWNLGEVLYFTGEQAKFNLALGKLEMEKALGLGCGYWYTFKGKMKQKQYLYCQEFLRQKNQQLDEKVYQELELAYGKKVNIYNLGVVLLELLGQYFQILPDKKYSFLTFTKKIKQSYVKNKQEEKVEDLLNPFSRSFLSPRFLFEKQQFSRLLEGKEAYTLHKETLYLLKEFLEYLEKTTMLEEE